MDRYAECFKNLHSKGEGAFVPFTVIGDPDANRSLQIIKTLAGNGADALELGIPFSDPLADGPTIQAAMDRALKSNTNPKQCLEIIEQFRKDDQATPIGLLVYANLVNAFGVDAFYEACAEAGVDSVLIADVPVDESGPFCNAATKYAVAPVLLCPPNIDELALKKVAELGRGYTYLLSRAGVTGTGVQAAMPVEKILTQLAKYKAASPLLGFGISKPEHVSHAISAGAKGVIVGSAIVQIIQQNLDDMAVMQKKLGHYVRQMKAATTSL